MTHTSSSPQPAASVHALADVLPLPLQHTLNSLTVNLDQELARYRQQKQGIMPQPQPVFRPRPRLLSLIDVKGQASSASAAAVASAPASPPTPPQNPKLSHLASVDTSPEGAGGALATQIGAPDASETYLASSAALLDSLAADPHPVGPQEALLADKPWTHILGTPLGMGGLLLLLVASAGLGYALVNPAAMQHLATQTPLGRFWDSEQASSMEGEQRALDQSPAALQRPDLSQSEFTDLNLSSLSTLPSGGSRLLEDAPDTVNSTPTTGVGPTATDATPKTTAAPTTPAANPPAPASAPPASAPQVAVAPAQGPVSQPRPATPAATTLPAVPAAATPVPAQVAEPISQPGPPAPEAIASDQTYYVVTEYTGDPSLAEARQVVGDAYLHNFPIGARIQLGAYDTAADAEADAAALRNQGISATVYTP